MKCLYVESQREQAENSASVQKLWLGLKIRVLEIVNKSILNHWTLHMSFFKELQKNKLLCEREELWHINKPFWKRIQKHCLPPLLF